jgi:hypothetical protein
MQGLWLVPVFLLLLALMGWWWWHRVVVVPQAALPAWSERYCGEAPLIDSCRANVR